MRRGLNIHYKYESKFNVFGPHSYGSYAINAPGMSSLLTQILFITDQGC